MKSDCLSCDIVSGKETSPGGTIYETDHWHVDTVLAPVFWEGFLIIKLKRHCEHLGVKHIHFWALPRPRTIRPGMRRVSRHRNMRAGLTRLGIKRWVYSDEEVTVLADRLRQEFTELD